MECFVPCDFNGNVLDKFLHIVDGGLSREWKESNKCVLFFGFEYDSKMEYWHNNEISFDHEYVQNKTIEDLVKYNLVLTESANKQIGL